MDKIDRLKFSELRMLSAAIELKSLSKTGERFGVTPSAVSKQISKLEEDVGCRLLERTTRNIRATPAGLALVKKTEPLLEGLVDALDSVAEEETIVSGNLAISATPAFGQTKLLQVVSNLTATHDQLRIELKISERLLDFVEDDIDVAIREGQLGDSSNIARLIGKSALKLVASKEYLALHKKPKRINDLSGHDIIAMRSPHGADNISRWKEKGGKPLKLVPRFMVDDLLTVRELALAGTGIGGLPGYIANDHIASGQLVHVLPDFPTRHLEIHALYPSKRFLPKRVKVFLEEISKVQL